LATRIIAGAGIVQWKLREMPLLILHWWNYSLRAFRASICRPGTFKMKPKYKFSINQVTLNSNSIQNTVHKFTESVKGALFIDAGTFGYYVKHRKTRG
jgi:hypothetical protein